MPRGVLVPIIFWVCFFGFIAWSIYPHSAQQDARPSRLKDKSQKNPKADQADNAKEQPAPQSPAFRIILKWENPDETNWSKPNCEHPQSHDEADLCEQRQTVLLNGRQVGIGILTLFGLAFTVFLHTGLPRPPLPLLNTHTLQPPQPKTAPLLHALRLPLPKGTLSANRGLTSMWRKLPLPTKIPNIKLHLQ